MLSTVFGRSFSSCVVTASPVSHVTIVGAGVMGTGIAQIILQAGTKVTLVDQAEDVLKKSVTDIRSSLLKLSSQRKESPLDEASRATGEIMRNLHTSTKSSKAVSDTDLVIEAVPDDLKLKKDLFKTFDEAARPSTILASNTSGLSIKELSSVTGRKDRFLGLHFFNPVPVMKCVEVVRTEHLAESTIDTVQEFCKAIGKHPLVCRDKPGFMINRLLVPLLLDAILIAERGDATVEDIDLAVRHGLGYPIGPFELIDQNGLEQYFATLEDWAKNHPETTVVQSNFLREKISAGYLGKKVGRGLYQYPSK